MNVPACEDCGAEGVALADYYALASYPQPPLWLCGGCEQGRAERAEEARVADFYGGDSPTEAGAMEAARRLK